MEIRHGFLAGGRVPRRVAQGDLVRLEMRTHPVAPAQAVTVEWSAKCSDGTRTAAAVAARWDRNEGGDSVWHAEIGPFVRGARVDYVIRASQEERRVVSEHSFHVGPRIHLALIWHQHQPAYACVSREAARGSYRAPWVRLHALRDYFSMAALVAEQPGLRATINLTPILLQQLEDYVSGATDAALELTMIPAERLTAAQRERVLSTFFDADWHTQILAHERYAELFLRRAARGTFDSQDIRDLQAWFSLAWFAPELRESHVRRFVEKGRGFTPGDIDDIVAIQLQIIAQVAPLHAALQRDGRIEVSTTPYAHPILPLLIDTDGATIDRPGATRPQRFSHPEDADAQIARAVEQYARVFGQPPRGMWPAEGAVSQASIALYARHDIAWIASDRGVLERSGKHGYEVDRPEVQCRPYRAEENGRSVAMFFRDTSLSDAVGFRYASWSDQDAAARDFVRDLEQRLADKLDTDERRVATVVLDGENAWGRYPGEGRPFLRALYRELAASKTIETTTPAAFLEGTDGTTARRAIERLDRVHDLFTGSWIDEVGSAPGVDLGTWIGEPEENEAIDLLREAREGIDLATAPGSALEALFRAEGSDWFWWFGSDQDSGHDDFFDDLFRAHVADVYRMLGRAVPESVGRSIVPRAVSWQFTAPVREIDRRDRVIIVTNCPGELVSFVDDGPPRSDTLRAVGGVMAGQSRHQVTLGPFEDSARLLRFVFRCGGVHCRGDDPCCRLDPQEISLAGSAKG